MEKENKKCFIGLKIKKLPFLTISMLLLGLLIYGYFFTGFFKTKVKILENYDFDKGNWVLMKGIYGDSVQYIITDVNVLNKLKEDWVLYKTEKEFATTGGYNVALYSDKGRMMIMDIINDGWLSRQKSDILYSSDYETLGYSDLNWLDDCSSSWKKVYRYHREFNFETEKSKMLDSLKTTKNVIILSDTSLDTYTHEVFYVEYLCYAK